jgi:mono/diheme cytochrome c family protein
MSDRLILGLFHEATPTANAIDTLEAQLGVPEEKISVISGIPYTTSMLGRGVRYERLVPIALAGAVGGLLTGLFLAAGTPLLYPLVVNGQPYIPIPPSLIILFELTMMGTIVATFAGLLAESRFPGFGRAAYDEHITEGHIGLLVEVDEMQLDAAQKILTDQGSHHIQRIDEPPKKLGGTASRWAMIIAGLLIPALVVLLFTYGIIAIKLPNQMDEQFSTAAEQGPRLAAPADAVPVQGPEMIAGQPATEPLPATADSIQRGEVLFSIDCALCHGRTAKGNGSLSAYFSPPPADLTGDSVKAMSDGDIFQVITEGRGLMPSIAENLSVNERWDVINYVRSLEK